MTSDNKKLKPADRCLSRLVRLPLFLVVAPLEIVLLLVCWGLVYVRPSLARKLHDWAVRSLPDKSWYGLPNVKVSCDHGDAAQKTL